MHLITTQLLTPLIDQRAQVTIRHAIDRLIHDAEIAMAATVTQERALRPLLDKLALPACHARAGLVPCQDLQLRETLRVDALRVDGHAVGLAVIAIEITGIGVVKKELTCSVFLEHGCQEVAIAAPDVREVIKTKG